MQINDGRVVSNFIVQALNNDPITIYGSGEQTRSFCYVDDLVEGILKFTYQEKEFGPVNIGNPKEITVLELADIICVLTGSRSKIQFKSLPQDDPVRRKPDISKIMDLIQWQPKVSLEDGLKETISYFKNSMK
jgi:UDP-glucuronate decarboxylase